MKINKLFILFICLFVVSFAQTNACTLSADSCTCDFYTNVDSSSSIEATGDTTATECSMILHAAGLSIDIASITGISGKTLKFTKDETVTDESSYDNVFFKLISTATEGTAVSVEVGFNFVELQSTQEMTVKPSAGTYLKDLSTEQKITIDYQETDKAIIGLSTTGFLVTGETFNQQEVTVKGGRMYRLGYKTDGNGCHKDSGATKCTEGDDTIVDSSSLSLFVSEASQLVGTWKKATLTVTEGITHEFTTQFSASEVVIDSNNVFDFRVSQTTLPSVSFGDFKIYGSANNYLDASITLISVSSLESNPSDKTLFTTNSFKSYSLFDRSPASVDILCVGTAFRVSLSSNNVCTYSETDLFVESDCKKYLVDENCISDMVLSFGTQGIPSQFTSQIKAQMKTIDTTSFVEETEYKLQNLNLKEFTLTVPSIEFNGKLGKLTIQNNLEIQSAIFTTNKLLTDIVQTTFTGYFYADTQVTSTSLTVVNVGNSYYRYDSETASPKCTITKCTTSCNFKETDCQNIVSDFKTYTLELELESVNKLDLSSLTSHYEFKSLSLSSAIEISGESTGTFIVDTMTISVSQNIQGLFTVTHLIIEDQTTPSIIEKVESYEFSESYSREYSYFLTTYNTQSTCQQISDTFFRCFRSSSYKNRKKAECYLASSQDFTNKLTFIEPDCMFDQKIVKPSFVDVNVGENINLEMSTSYTYKSLTISSNDISIVLPQVEFLTINIGNDIHEFLLNVKGTSSINIDSSSIKGKITLGSTSSAISTTIVPPSLFSLISNVDLTIQSSYIKSSEIGNNLKWYNNKENTCELSASTFLEEDYCSTFTNYENINLIISSSENPSTDFNNKKFATCTLSFGTTKPTDLSSIHCASMIISESLTIGNIDNLEIVGDNLEIISGELGTVTMKGTYISLTATSIETLKKSFEIDESIVEIYATSVNSYLMDFYGNVPSVEDTKKQQTLGTNFKFYSQQDFEKELYECPMTDSTTSSDEVCAYFIQKSKINFAEIQANIQAQFTGDSTTKYKGCLIETTGSISGLLCTKTTITVSTFDISTSNIGEITFNDVSDNISRQIKQTKISGLGSDYSTVVTPLFYGYENEVSNLGSCSFSETHSSYFANGNEQCSCKTTSQTKFNFANCIDQYSQTIPLVVEHNDFTSSIIFKSAEISQTVTTITQLKVKEDAKFQSATTTIQNIECDSITFPQTYTTFIINGGIVKTYVKETNGGLSPLFIGNIDNTNGAFTVSAISSTMNRYYPISEEGSTLCTCSSSSTTLFNEWDCNIETTANFDKYSLSCSVTGFTFTAPRKYATYVLETASLEELTLINLKVNELQIQSTVGKTIKFTGRNTVITTIKPVVDGEEIVVYSDNSVTSIGDLNNQQVSDGYRWSTTDKFYCTIVESTTSEPKFAESDCQTDKTLTTRILRVTDLSYLTEELSFAGYTFATVEFTLPNEGDIKLYMKDAIITTLTLPTSEKKFIVECQTISTLNIDEVTQYEITATIGSLIFTTNVKEPIHTIITGSVGQIKLSGQTSTSTMLFILKSTSNSLSSISGMYLTMINSDSSLYSYRVASTNLKTCTYSSVTDGYQLTPFDCSLNYMSETYSTKSIELVFKNGVSGEIILDENELHTFVSSTLLTTIEHIENLEVGSLTMVSAIEIETCTIDELIHTNNEYEVNIIDSTISESFTVSGKLTLNIQDSTIEEIVLNSPSTIEIINTEITTLTMNVLMNKMIIENSQMGTITVPSNSEGKIFAIEHKVASAQSFTSDTTGFSVMQISPNYERIVIGSGYNKPYCTISQSNKFDEWDCLLDEVLNDITDDSSSYYFILKVATTGTVTIPQDLLTFNAIDLSSLKSLTTIQSASEVSIVNFDLTYQTDVILDFALTTKLTCGSNSITPFTLVTGELTVTGVSECDQKEYILSTTAKVTYQNVYSTQMKGLTATGMTFYRLSGLNDNENVCHLSSNCNFVEGDCHTVGTYTFSSTEISLEILGSKIEYTCSGYEWASVSLNNNLELTGNPITSDILILTSGPITVSQVLTVTSELHFIQNSNSNTRTLNSLALSESVEVKVFDETYLETPMSPIPEAGSLTNQHLLFTGKISGLKPENVNADGCTNDYYYKVDLSACECILLSEDLEATTEIFKDDATGTCQASVGNANNQFVLTVSTANVNIKTTDFVFSAIRVSQATTFTCGLSTECVLRIKDFHPTQKIIVGENVKLVIDAFGESDSTTVIYSEGIVSFNDGSKTLDDVHIPIITPKNNLFGQTLTSNSFTYNGKTCYRYFNGKTTLECLDTEITPDCLDSQYSEHYTIKCTTETCSIKSNYQSLVIEGTVNTCTISSNSEVIRTITNFVATSNAIFAKTISITSVDNNALKYLLFDTNKPTTITSSSTKYSYNLISSESQSDSNLHQCGSDTTFYRYGEDCLCVEESFLPDCSIPEHIPQLDYSLVKSTEVSIDKYWNSVIDNVSGEAKMIIEFAIFTSGKVHNIVIKGSRPYQIQGASSITSVDISIDFTNQQKQPYVYVGEKINVKSVKNVKTTDDVLFVSPKTHVSLTTLSSSKCTNAASQSIYRYFTTTTGVNTIGCKCQVSDPTFNFIDCAEKEISVYYDLILYDEYLLETPWKSVSYERQMVHSEEYKLTINGGVAQTIYDKSNGGKLSIIFKTSTATEIVPNGNTYLYVTFEGEAEKGSDLITINPSTQLKYYLTTTHKDKFTLNGLSADACESEDVYRINNGLSCYCSLADPTKAYVGATELNYPDCIHTPLSSEEVQFDLLITTSTISFEAGATHTSFKSFAIDTTKSLTSITINNLATELTFREASELNIPLTLTGNIVTIGSITLKDNGKIYNKLSEKLTLTTVTMPVIYEFLESTSDQRLEVEIGELDLPDSSETVVIARANHYGFTITSQTTKAKILGYNDKTTIHYGPAGSVSDEVVCVMNRQGANHNGMFTHINCPCDDNEKCKIIINAQSPRSITLGSNSIATWNIEGDEVHISGSIPGYSDEISKIVSQSKIILSEFSTISSLESTKLITIDNDEKECVIGNIKDSSILTTGSGLVTMTIAGTMSSIDCKNCKIQSSSSSAVISQLQFGNSRSITFQGDNTLTLKDIIFNDGVSVPIQFTQTVPITLAPTSSLVKPLIPILISENGNLVTVDKSDTNYVVGCKPSKLFYHGSEIEFMTAVDCTMGDSSVITPSEDSATVCDGVDYCSLTVSENTISNAIQGNYHSIIFQVDSSISFSNSIKDILIECPQKKKVTITGGSLSTIKSKGCDIEITTITSQTVSVIMFASGNSIRFTEEGKTLALTTPLTLGPIIVSGTLEITSDITVTGDVSDVGLLKLTSGSFIVNGNVETKVTEISEGFGKFVASTFSAETIDQSTDDCFLNHDIEYLSNVYYEKSCLSTTQTSEGKHKYCIANSELQTIQANNVNHFKNHINSGCGNVANQDKIYYLDSQTFVIDEEFTCEQIQGESINIVGKGMLSGQIDGSASIFVKSELTGTDSSEIDIYVSGQFNEFSAVTISTEDLVNLKDCNDITLNTVPTISLTKTDETDMTITINNFNGYSHLYDNYITITTTGDVESIPLTLNKGSSATDITNEFIFLKSDKPIQLTSTITGVSQKCHNTIICFNCENTKFDCDSYNETPEDGISYVCDDSEGNEQCLANVSPSGNQVTIGRENIYQINLESTSTCTDFTLAITHNDKLEELIVDISCTVTIDYLPKNVIVKRGSIIINIPKSSSDNIETSLIGSPNTAITLNNNGQHVTFVKITVDSLTLNGFNNDDIYAHLIVSHLTLSESSFNIFGNVKIDTLTIGTYDSDSTLFTVTEVIESIEITSYSNPSSTVCLMIFNLQGVPVTPILNLPDTIPFDDNLYYDNCEESKLNLVDTCSLTEELAEVTSEMTLYVYESSYYTPYSLCPDATKKLDFSQSKSSTLHLDGLENPEFSSIRLPDSASMTSSSTNVIVIKELKGCSITFNSKFEIETLIIDPTAASTCVLNFGADVSIGSIVNSNSVSVDFVISNGVVVTYEDETSVLSLNKVKILGTITSLIIPSTTLNVNSLEISCSRTDSVNALITTKKLTSTSLSVSCIEGQASTVQAIVFSEEDIDKSQIGSSASVVCSKRTLVYPSVSSSSKFVCSNKYVCSSTITDCFSNRDDKSTQIYEFTISESEVSLLSNMDKINGYDIVHVKTSSTITLNSESKYVFIVDENIETTIDCQQSTDCYVAVLGKGTVTLKGKGTVFESSDVIDSLEEATNGETTVKLTDNSDFTFGTIEMSNLLIELSGTSIMRISTYGSFKKVTMEGTSKIIVSETFDIDEFIYYSGLIEVKKIGAVVGLKDARIETQEVNNVISIVKATFEGIEKIWDGTVSLSDALSDNVVLAICSKSVLEMYPKSMTYECPSISCSDADRASRDICYCSYNPKVGQDCEYKCEDNQCYIREQMGTIPSFNKLGVENGATINIAVPTIFSQLEVSSNLVINTNVPIYIHSIVDGSCNDYETCTLTISTPDNTEVDIVIEKIDLRSTKSHFIIKTFATEVKQIHVEKATLDVYTTFILNDYSQEEEEVSLIPYSEPQTFENKQDITSNIVREVVFADCTVIFYDNAGIEVYGPKYTVSFTETNDDVDYDYNKMTITNVNMTVVGTVTKENPTVIYFDIVGTVTIDDLEGTFKPADEESTEPQYLNLIQNNLPKHITATQLKGKIRPDEQEYSLIIVNDNIADINSIVIEEISCALRSGSYSGQFNEMSKGIWDRGTCPCHGDGCIIDVSSSRTPILYDMTDRVMDKFIGNSADISGTNINIEEIEVVGPVNFQTLDTKTEILAIGENGIATFTSNFNITNVINLDGEHGGKLAVYNGYFGAKSISGVGLEIGASGIVEIINATADFRGQTLNIAKGGRLDIYSEHVQFNSETTIEVRFDTAGMLQPISVADNILGQTASVASAKFIVHIPGDEGKFYPLIRLKDTDLSSVNVDIQVGPASSKRDGSNTFKVVKACSGIVVTDLSEKDITCPHHIMDLIVGEPVFPFYIIIVVVIFVIILVVMIIIFIVYLVHVMLQRRANMKVFDEGEEVELDLGQNEDKDDDEEGETGSGSESGSGSGSGEEEEGEEGNEESKESSEKEASKESSESEKVSEKEPSESKSSEKEPSEKEEEQEEKSLSESNHSSSESKSKSESSVSSSVSGSVSESE